MPRVASNPATVPSDAKVAPVADAAGVKKGPKPKDRHPLIDSTDKQKLPDGTIAPIYPFGALPADYNFRSHAALKKADFANEGAYWAYKASESEWKMKRFQKRAEECRMFGSGEEAKDAKKFLRMQEKMAELAASLAGQGVDVEKLLAQFKSVSPVAGKITSE